MSSQASQATPTTVSQSATVAQPQQLSRTKITVLCNAVRIRLRPYLVPHQVLEPYLATHNWSIHAATQHLFRDVHRRQQQVEPQKGPDDNGSDEIASGPDAESDVEDDGQIDRQLPSRSTTPYEPVDAEATIPASNIDLFQALVESNISVESNPEQCRREIVLRFAVHVLKRLKAMLSISEATLLLLLDDWDIGKAVEAFKNHESARRRLREQFDAMRSDTQNSNEQSARISILFWVTDRPDWYSMKIYLQKHKWDVIRAVVEWYKNGIRPFVSKDLTTAMKKMPGFGLRVDCNCRRLIKPSLDDTVPSSDADEENWAHETDDYSNEFDTPEVVPIVPSAAWKQRLQATRAVPGYTKDKNVERPPGFAVQVDRRPVSLGVCHPADFLIEWFAKGRYWFGRWKHQAFLWAEVEVNAMAEDDSYPEDDGSSDEILEEEADLGVDEHDDHGLFLTESAPIEGRVSIQAASRDLQSGDRAGIFDRDNQAHVDLLNMWRREVYSRVFMQNVRLSAQPWSQVELDFLYQLMQNLYDEWKTLFPRRTRQEILSAITITQAEKNEWARKLNRQFTGSVMEGQTVARRDRTGVQIVAQRSRDARIGILFRLKMNPVYMKRVDSAVQAQYETERDGLEAADVIETEKYVADHPEEKEEEKFPKPRPESANKRKRGGQGDGEDDEASDSDIQGRSEKKR